MKLANDLTIPFTMVSFVRTYENNLRDDRWIIIVSVAIPDCLRQTVATFSAILFTPSSKHPKNPPLSSSFFLFENFATNQTLFHMGIARGVDPYV